MLRRLRALVGAVGLVIGVTETAQATTILKAYTVAGSGSYHLTLQEDTGSLINSYEFFVNPGLTFAMSNGTSGDGSNLNPEFVGFTADQSAVVGVPLAGSGGTVFPYPNPLPTVTTDVDPSVTQFSGGNLGIHASGGWLPVMVSAGGAEYYLGEFTSSVIMNSNGDSQPAFFCCSRWPMPVEIAVLPEPSSTMLLSLGLAGFAVLRRRRNQSGPA